MDGRTDRTNHVESRAGQDGASEAVRDGVVWQIPARTALLLIRGYKVLISPYFRGSCRFLPSCADYAAEAIATHGFVRGTWLAAKRLSRCQPLCSAGHDPVPPRRVRKGPHFISQTRSSAALSGSR
jgi:putative membrane protein insertion efficiency factor